MSAFNPKLRACAHCETSFTPARPMQSVCSPICAARKVKADKARERVELKKRRAALKRIPDLVKEAQIVFNQFTRERDRRGHQICVSCGRLLDWSGNGVDAGHYRSVGSAPHLRFDERNCHAQCKQCNQWKSGNAVDYRIGLIQRIGLEAVEALEADNRIHKWQRDELIAIRSTYKAKRKALLEQEAINSGAEA
jgi:hypothetical protein